MKSMGVHDSSGGHVFHALDIELGLKVMTGKIDRHGSHVPLIDMTLPVQNPTTTKSYSHPIEQSRIKETD